jgi:hypothetical protein
MVMNQGIPQLAANFLTSLSAVIFPRSALFEDLRIQLNLILRLDDFVI